MASFSEFWNDIVRKLFAALAPDTPALLDAPCASPRQGETCAAPCSVYQSRRDSFAMQNGSVCPGSVCEGAGSVQAVRNVSFATPAPSPMPVHESVIIPFKDGSSQIFFGRPSFVANLGQGGCSPDPQQNLVGGSFLRSEAYRSRENQFFISDPEDMVDVQVAKYFEANPQAYMDTKFTRVRQGVYSMRGREVNVEWIQAPGKDKQKGRLMVRDGAQTMTLADCLDAKDKIAPLPLPELPKFAQSGQNGDVAPQGPEYTGSIFQAKNNLQTIPKECRVTFNDAGFDYSRIDAMKVAKEQALVREAAAKVTTQGKVPSVDRISSRYEKNMDARLGRQRRHTEISIPTATSVRVGAPPPVARTQMPGTVKMAAPAPLFARQCSHYSQIGYP